MPRGLLLLALALSLIACGGERAPEGEPAAADTSGPIVVPFHGVLLRVAPEDTAAVMFEVAAGNPLRVIETVPGWARLATWDERSGWAPESAVMDLSLWAHYQQALGGAPLSDVRPAYALEDGRWAVEAPPPSPGVVTSGTLWILGGPAAASGNFMSVENVASSCGETYRVGILADAPAAVRARADSARLAGALLATTAVPQPTLQALAVRDTAPGPGDAEAIRALADGLVAVIRAASPGDSTAPVRFAPARWLALGEGALWATLAGEPGREEPDADSWAAAVTVRAGRATLVVPPHRSPGLGLRPVLALTTAGGPPTLLLVLRAGEGGYRLEGYVARENDYRRFYQGYAWGC